MCAFSMMYFQDPSLLQFQRRMEDAQETSNLETLFKVHSIPRAFHTIKWRLILEGGLSRASLVEIARLDGSGVTGGSPFTHFFKSSLYAPFLAAHYATGLTRLTFQTGSGSNRG